MKLFVATPIYGLLPAATMQSFMRLQEKPPCNLEIHLVVGDSLVCRARNALTHDFLKSDCTHLLFIDSDLVFSPEHVGRLAGHAEAIVGGLYPKKCDGPVQWVINTFPQVPEGRDGVLSVRYLGTGFLRIARAVFEDIGRAGLAPSYPCDHDPKRIEQDFWRVGVWRFPDGTARYLSEDWWFCQAALDCGHQVHADTRIVCKHIGTHTWPNAEQHKTLFQKQEAESGKQK